MISKKLALYFLLFSFVEGSIYAENHGDDDIYVVFASPGFQSNSNQVHALSDLAMTRISKNVYQQTFKHARLCSEIHQCYLSAEMAAPNTGSNFPWHHWSFVESKIQTEAPTANSVHGSVMAVVNGKGAIMHGSLQILELFKNDRSGQCEPNEQWQNMIPAQRVLLSPIFDFTLSLLNHQNLFNEIQLSYQSVNNRQNHNQNFIMVSTPSQSAQYRVRDIVISKISQLSKPEVSHTHIIRVNAQHKSENLFATFYFKEEIIQAEGRAIEFANMRGATEGFDHYTNFYLMLPAMQSGHRQSSASGLLFKGQAVDHGTIFIHSYKKDPRTGLLQNLSADVSFRLQIHSKNEPQDLKGLLRFDLMDALVSNYVRVDKICGEIFHVK